MRHVSFLSALAMVVGGVVGPVTGQVRIEQGQVLDANLRLGSGGLNPARPPHDFQAGNRIVTGNVPFGRGFRGFSPISDPRTFGLGSTAVQGGVAAGDLLPSDRLTGFFRDSYNIADYRGFSPYRTDLTGPAQLTGPSAGAFYSPYSTVDTTGRILLGRRQAGTLMPRDPFQVPLTDLARPGLTESPLAEGLAHPSGPLTVPTRMIRAYSDVPVDGQVNQRLLASPLFGVAFREVPVTELAAQARAGEGVARVESMAPPASLMGPLDVRVGRPERLTERAERPDDPLGWSHAHRGQDLARVMERAAEEEAFTTPRLAQPPEHGLDAQDLAEAPRLMVDPEAVATGRPGDVYSWMRDQTARQQLLRPIGPETEEPALPEDLAAVDEMPVAPEAVRERAPELDDETYAAPSLETFVGEDDSLLNRQLAYAEQALQEGRYYRAAEAYLVARTIAPDNPLPVLGRSMALLAAGDYLSSVGDLFDAIRLFGPLGAFRIDLASFLPDVHVIDLRRADLERRLEVHEDARLRFLLGYAEYCSGLEEFGLANMKKAVEQGGQALRTGSPAPEVAPREDAFRETVEQFLQILKARHQGHDTPVRVPDSR